MKKLFFVNLMAVIFLVFSGCTTDITTAITGAINGAITGTPFAGAGAALGALLGAMLGGPWSSAGVGAWDHFGF